jgi:mannosyltransferase
VARHPGRRAPDWFKVCLLIQVVAATFMFGVSIGRSPFWFDELVSVSVANRSVAGIFDTLHHQDLNMGVYYLLLHAWGWAGHSEAWLRWLSALPAIAAVPTTAILARRLFGDAVGIVAGFLLIGNLFVVSNAQNARSYALGLLLITLATLLFVEAIQKRRPALFVAYGAASLAAVYVTPLSGLVLAAHAVSIPFLPRARELRRPLALTYAGMALAVAPLAVGIFMAGGGQVDYLTKPGLTDLRTAGVDLLGSLGNRPLKVAYGALVVAGIIVLLRGRIDREDREPRPWRRSLVIAWLLLPPAALFVFSQAKPLFLSRYLLGITPAVAITASIGLVALARHSRALGAAAAVIVICLVVPARIDLGPNGGNSTVYSDAAARVMAVDSRAGDGLVYPAPYARLFDYYLSREAAAGAHLPSDFAIAAPERGHLAFYADEAPPEARERRLLAHRRVWLLQWNWSGTSSDSVPTLDLLRSRYTPVSRSAFGGGNGTSVELFVRNPDSGE